MTDIFLFSLVRDPVDRLLSAYYEVNTRDVNIFEVYGIAHKHGMDKFRALLTAFWTANREYLGTGLSGATGLQAKQLWSAEAHFHPQLLFLLNKEFEPFPLNYVGDLQDFEQIIRP